MVTILHNAPQFTAKNNWWLLAFSAYIYASWFLRWILEIWHVNFSHKLGEPITNCSTHSQSAIVVYIFFTVCLHFLISSTIGSLVAWQGNEVANKELLKVHKTETMAEFETPAPSSTSIPGSPYKEQGVEDTTSTRSLQVPSFKSMVQEDFDCMN